jgi:hypothetical protein
VKITVTFSNMSVSAAGLPDVVPPGLKLELLGPVECRRGLLLLTPASVRVLGGAVEEIAHQFAADRVLADRIAGRVSMKLLSHQFRNVVKKFAVFSLFSSVTCAFCKIAFA